MTPVIYPLECLPTDTNTTKIVFLRIFASFILFTNSRENVEEGDRGNYIHDHVIQENNFSLMDWMINLYYHEPTPQDTRRGVFHHIVLL